MSGPLPGNEEDILCPQCGAKVTPGLPKCWLCGAEQDEAPRDARRSSARFLPTGPQAPPHRARVAFSLGTMLLVTTVVAVGCGLLTIAPGLAISVCILLAPVLLRTMMVVKRRERAGYPVSTMEKAWLIVSSLVMAHIILGVVAVTAVGTFCGVCMIASPSTGGDPDKAIPIALTIVAVLSISLLVGIGFLIRARFRHDVNKGSDLP